MDFIGYAMKCSDQTFYAYRITVLYGTSRSDWPGGLRMFLPGAEVCRAFTVGGGSHRAKRCQWAIGFSAVRKFHVVGSGRFFLFSDLYRLPGKSVELVT